MKSPETRQLTRPSMRESYARPVQQLTSIGRTGCKVSAADTGASLTASVHAVAFAGVKGHSVNEATYATSFPFGGRAHDVGRNSGHLQDHSRQGAVHVAGGCPRVLARSMSAA